MSDIKAKTLKICVDTKKSSNQIANLDSDLKNQILNEAIKLLKKNSPKIIKANQKDIRNAKENKLDSAKIDRLILDEKKINSLILTIKEIIKLPDPVSKILYQDSRENGLNIAKISIPIGVLLAIYESRPNVTADVAALAIKSGNAVILRSGSDAFNTSKILADIFRESLEKFNIDKNVVNFVQESDRKYVSELLLMDRYIDVVIPRGGKSLIEAISKNTQIPLFKHLDGNCHTYIHEKADFEKARKILLNAKMRRVSICGATESLLIDKKIAKKILPLIASDLSNLKCEMRGDSESMEIDKRIKKAKDEDFYSEYLDKIISIKIVKDIEEAIKHITTYGSSHTESIITEDKNAADKFLKYVNSAIVMHNASTQFADGGEFGFGAEVGISTGKLHARGPVGLEQLTTHKYIVRSDFAIRS